MTTSSSRDVNTCQMTGPVRFPCIPARSFPASTHWKSVHRRSTSIPTNPMSISCAKFSTPPWGVCASWTPMEPCWRRSVMATIRMNRRAPRSLRYRRCPRGMKSSRARRSEASTLPLARLIRMILRTRVLLVPIRTFRSVRSLGSPRRHLARLRLLPRLLHPHLLPRLLHPHLPLHPHLSLRRLPPRHITLLRLPLLRLPLA